MDDMQPGVIIPHDSEEPKQPGIGAPPEPDRPLQGPHPGPGPVPAPNSVPEPAVLSVAEAVPYGQDSSWQSRQEAPPAQPQSHPADTLAWTASEFIAHEKNAGWYGLLIVAGLVAAVLDYLATKDVFSTVIIIFAAVALAVFAARKPRTQEYALSYHGIQIGAKTYGFQDFKNFSITEEGAITSVVFMPLKRFMPTLTIYVPPDMENQVVEFLSELLPFEAHKADAVDALMRRIHF